MHLRCTQLGSQVWLQDLRSDKGCLEHVFFLLQQIFGMAEYFGNLGGYLSGLHGVESFP